MNLETHELISDLRLFNEKADRLARARLSIMRENSDMELSIQFANGRVTQVVYAGPDEDSLDAFVLTLRLFLQKNERISFGRMSDLYSASIIAADLREEFEQVRSRFNVLLDTPTNFTVYGEQLTRRTILHVFLYGGLAHANREKQGQYELWMGSIAAPVFQMYFVQAVELVQSAVSAAKEINERALRSVTAESA